MSYIEKFIKKENSSNELQSEQIAVKHEPADQLFELSNESLIIKCESEKLLECQIKSIEDETELSVNVNQDDDLEEGEIIDDEDNDDELNQIVLNEKCTRTNVNTEQIQSMIVKYEELHETISPIETKKRHRHKSKKKRSKSISKVDRNRPRSKEKSRKRKRSSSFTEEINTIKNLKHERTPYSSRIALDEGVPSSSRFSENIQQINVPQIKTEHSDDSEDEENTNKVRGHKYGRRSTDEDKQAEENVRILDEDEEKQRNRGRRYPGSFKSNPGDEYGTKKTKSKAFLFNRYEIINSRPNNCLSKRGKEGDLVRLQTNYYRIIKRPEWTIYQHHIHFKPDIKTKNVRCSLLSKLKSELGGYLFDGAVLYMTKRFPEEKVQFVVQNHLNEAIQISIKFVNVISMHEWQSLQVLSIILKHSLEGLNLQLLGKHFYDALSKIEVRNFNLQLWPGFITSIRNHENDILLCTEIAYKALRTNTAHDLMIRCIKDYDLQLKRYDRNSKMELRTWKESYGKAIIGSIVLTDYNNQTYRIIDVDFKSSPENTFDVKNTTTTFIDYYYQKHRIHIKDPDQPLLVSRNKKNKGKSKQGNDIVLLIPELCRVIGITTDMKREPRLMRSLADITRTDPSRRIQLIRSFNRRLQETPSSQKVLKDWHMGLDKELLKVNGRILQEETIYFRDGKKELSGPNCDWTKSVRELGMFNEIHLSNWTVICPQKFYRDGKSFIDKVIRSGNGMLMDISKPRWMEILDDSKTVYYQKAIERAADDDPKLVVCVVANNAMERYSAIKKMTCIDRALPTQVITNRVISNPKGILSIATKIAIQIAAKLGAAPWLVNIPVKGLMVVGYYTAKSFRDKSKSFSALVATMDQKLESKYYSTVTQGKGSDHTSDDLLKSFTNALLEYKDTHNSLPLRIFLYRDSVGDSLLKRVFEHEVRNLVLHLEKEYKKHNLAPPKLTFVVVNKSTNTKFFSGSKHNAQNPAAGTIVDDVVTLPERYDFYLISQTCRQGTASPTNYNILYDSSGLQPDYIQRLTYKMCHLYYNWSGTTRIPAVCQYAKKLATLVCHSLHTRPSCLLEKQLYFL